jgi:hypothetical protein
VLGNQRGNTLTFVPLRAARPVARHALAPGKAFGPLAAAAR